uniref:Uncharacterized protein LOC111123635 n=1 Tax=Crassostrea virginica TaxID=6565 RepID=A0A8B8D0Y6_CRAVI|nr:uncharacterized protein LOC111123635 [Crassostrea virginica]
MANGSTSPRRYVIVAIWLLFAMEIRIGFCQNPCPPTPVVLPARNYPQFAHTPNFPQKYPRNCSCVWKIIAQAGLKIKFKVDIKSFIEASPNCNGDYAEVFDGNISMRKFCGSDSPELVSTSSILVVKFVSDNAVETMGMNFSYVEGSSFLRPTLTTTTESPSKKDKVKKSTLFAAVGGAVLCSVVFIIVLCVCLHTKRCACPCGRRNTAQTVEPFENQPRTHRNVSRTNSVFTSHLSRSVGSLPNDEVISLRVLSPPPYSSDPPPSIDSPTNSSSPPPPYSFNDPHPGAGRTDSLPGYPGEVGRY